MKKQLLNEIVEKKGKKIEFAIVTILIMARVIFLKRINLSIKVLKDTKTKSVFILIKKRTA